MEKGRAAIRLSEFRARAMVFDKDGVLVDTMAMIRGAWAEWANARGIDSEEVLASIHMTGVELIRRFAPSSDPAAELRWISAHQSNVERSIVAFPGALALLARLPRDTWAIVTSGRRETAQRHLQIAGLPLPDILISAEDTPRGKPDPAGFLLAARRLRVPTKACVAVEDSPAGVQAAIDAGMFVVAVTTTHPASELTRADMVIPSLSAMDVVVDPANELGRIRVTSGGAADLRTGHDRERAQREPAG